MSDRKVEIVRQGFDAFETMDMDAFVADWHPDVVWDVRGYRDWPGSRTEYRGAPEILAEFANFMGTVRSLVVTVHEVVALEDGRVLAIYTERRLNEGDPAPVELDIGIL
jgi:ketosteroid isomerase-like protein